MSSSIQVNNSRTLVTGSNRTVRVIILVLLLGAVVGFAYWGSMPGGDVLTDSLSEPLNGATAAKVDIHSGVGHLTIDRLTGGEQLLVSGTLQYLEDQGVPNRFMNTANGQATLTLRGGDAGRSGFRFPWQACTGGAYQWQVQLNPNVQSDLTAHSDGGNVTLNLTGMAVTRASADTGGGNVDVVLPDDASGLNVKASTGAGNVTVDVGSGITGSNIIDANSGAGNVVVRVPSGVAAKVHATAGLGKVTVDPRFNKTDKNTYRSSDYDGAPNRVEITVNSGAGNVSVETK